jgi:hypothetical protein
LKRKPVIDITVAPVDMWGDAAEHDRLRAQRVVEYIRHRFPAVRYDDALEDFDDRVRGRVLHETGKRKVI